MLLLLGVGASETRKLKKHGSTALLSGLQDGHRRGSGPQNAVVRMDERRNAAKGRLPACGQGVYAAPRAGRRVVWGASE